MNFNHCFSYLASGMPENIERLRYNGNFDEAVLQIDRMLSQNPDFSMKNSLIAHREMLLRLPAQYPFSYCEAMRIIREHIPDFTDDEFALYESDRKIGWIFINGEKRYFSRFFNTLCKTDPSFAARAGVTLPGVESATPESQANSVLNESMHLMKKNGQVSHRITVHAELVPQESLFDGRMHKVKAYLPVPALCEGQSDIKILSLFPKSGVISSETGPQRTICWEETVDNCHDYSVEYSYVSTSVYRDVESFNCPSTEQPGFDTEEIYPHVVFTPYIRALAAALTEDCHGPLEKARAFYDFITLNMSYTFMPDYFVLENIAENGARNRVGDCGVFALLFLTLCRASGIPAQWESGLAAEPDFVGGHDWIRFYVAPYGWLYADPSYGIAAKRVNNEERRRFYFGNRDAFRLVANTAFQADFENPMDGFRIDPYDNQLGELEFDGRGLQGFELTRRKAIIGFEKYIEL